MISVYNLLISDKWGEKAYEVPNKVFLHKLKQFTGDSLIFHKYLPHKYNVRKVGR